jgi:hypothetical protein
MDLAEGKANKSPERFVTGFTGSTGWKIKGGWFLVFRSRFQEEGFTGLAVPILYIP